MNRYHHLLIVLAALVAALALFFWPRSAAAAPGGGAVQSSQQSFVQRCEKEMRPLISVSAEPASFVVTTTVSTRVLNARATHASSTRSIMGMTASRTQADVTVDGPSLRDTTLGQECIAPRIDVVLRFEPLDVFVAREFSPQSCAYREVLRHEMGHVKLYTEQLSRIQALVRAELQQRYGRTIYAPAGAGVAELQRQVHAWLEPTLRREMAEVEVLQAQLDAPEAVDKLSHACLGEVATLMGSSF